MHIITSVKGSYIYLNKFVHLERFAKLRDDVVDIGKLCCDKVGRDTGSVVDCNETGRDVGRNEVGRLRRVIYNRPSDTGISTAYLLGGGEEYGAENDNERTGADMGITLDKVRGSDDSAIVTMKDFVASNFVKQSIDFLTTIFEPLKLS